MLTLRYWQSADGRARRWYVNNVERDKIVYLYPSQSAGEVDIFVDGKLLVTTLTDITVAVLRILGKPAGSELTVMDLEKWLLENPPDHSNASTPDGLPRSQARQTTGARGTNQPPGGRYPTRTILTADVRRRTREGIAAGNAQQAICANKGGVHLDPNAMKDPLPERTTLLVDPREPAEMIRHLRKVRGLEMELEPLSLGRYQVPNRCVFDRISANDFEDGILADPERFFWQSAKAGLINIPCVIFVEGWPGRATTTLQSAVLGSLSYMTMVQRAHVVMTPDPATTAYLLVRMLTHALFGVSAELHLRRHEPPNSWEAARYMIEGIPNIGPRVAANLLRHFGTVARFASATELDLLEVPGVTPALAAHIVEILHSTQRV